MGFDLISENKVVDDWHCSIFNWRPVHYIISEVSEPTTLFTNDELAIMTCNDGFRVDNTRAVILARLIQEYMKDAACVAGSFPDKFTLPCEDFRVDNKTSVFLTKEELEDPEVFKNSHSPYSISIGRLNEFVQFCKKSEGFGIY